MAALQETTTALDPSHLGDLFKAVFPSQTKWYNIGLLLGIQAHTLDMIKEDQRATSDCCREMLKEWLKGDSAHWPRLETALRSPTVREGGVASEIKRLYSRHHTVIESSDAPLQSDPASSLNSVSNALNSASSGLGSVSSLGSIDVVPYGCGCGNCTFASYVAGGCSDPKPSTSSFPFLETSELNDSEKQLLQGRLYDEYTQIMFKFSHLTRVVCESLIDRKVPLKKLIRSLRDLKAFEPTISNVQLLESRAMDLKKAKDIDDVFDILTDYTSFYSFQIIEHIVQEHGDGRDREELETYRGHFMEYCKRNIFECPAYSSLKKGQATLVLKVEDTVVEHGSMKHLQQLTTRVSRAFSLSKYTLTLCSVERGCVQVVYQLPVSVAQQLFPLKDNKREELGRLSVVKLVCDDYTWEFKPHSTRTRRSRFDLGLPESFTPTQVSPERSPPPLPPKTPAMVLPRPLPEIPADEAINETEILTQFVWYHGKIARGEAEIRLRRTGQNSFLIRRKQEVGFYVLSEIYNGECKHYIVEKTNGVYESLYAIEQKSFHTIPELVRYLEENFFFKPCSRTANPNETIKLYRSDWLVKTTPLSVEPETDLPDCTGESGYGTGETADGFPSAALRCQPKGPTATRVCEGPYTQLDVCTIDPHKPYTQVSRVDYTDIAQLEDRRPMETLHPQDVTGATPPGSDGMVTPTGSGRVTPASIYHDCVDELTNQSTV